MGSLRLWLQLWQACVCLRFRSRFTAFETAYSFPFAFPCVSHAFRAALRPVTTTRAAIHAAYVQAASGATRSALPALALRFTAALAKAWRLPCDNQVKETFWRLAINAIPGFNIRPWRCPCSPAHHDDPRAHAFWDCPMAAAVRTQLQAATGSAPTRRSLWLLTEPPHTVPPSLWTLVCVAAVHAMDHGRRHAWASVSAHHAAPAIGAAANQAALCFWTTLHAVARDDPPAVEGWGLTAATPFLMVVDGRLRVNMPS